MQFLWDMPIKRKLRLIIMLTSSIALLLACGSFIGYESVRSHSARATALSTLANIVAANSTAALLFNDPAAAGRTLSDMHAEKEIETACILTPDGKVFAAYRRPGIPERYIPPPAADGVKFKGDHAILYAPIVSQGERIGTVFVQSDLEEMHQRMRRYALIVAGVLALSGLVAWGLSTALERLVSAPILDLVTTARTITQSDNYTLRARARSQDELGMLVDSFNRMLAHVQTQDSALRNSERHFRSLIENASDIITIVDTEGTIHYKSPSLVQAMGYLPGQVIGKNITEFIDPRDVEGFLAAIRIAAADPDKRLTVEFRHRHTNGSWRAFEGICTRWTESEGDPRVVVNSRDVTERRQAEKQVQEANEHLADNQRELLETNENLQRSNEQLKAFQDNQIRAAKMETVGRLAAGVAHEVKNPLAVIMMGLDYLTSDYPPNGNENIPTVLKEMRESALRADTIVRELLAFSSSNRLEVAEEDLNEAIERSLQLVRHDLVKTHVRVEKDLHGNLPRLQLNRTKMEQVLINLFINATHAMSGGGTLSIRTFLRPAQPGNGSEDSSPVVVAEIADTGHGIPPGILPKIFEPFFTTKQVNQGTGLGLSVVKNIVELHGGTIVMGNRPEGGAQATITFKVERNKQL